eukprot:3542252-Pyramimonas_sp.AAC.1
MKHVFQTILTNLRPHTHPSLLDASHQTRDGHADFYLEKLDAEVSEAFHKHGGQKVHLVAHSAGGWLARIFLGDRKYNGRCYNGERM